MKEKYSRISYFLSNSHIAKEQQQNPTPDKIFLGQPSRFFSGKRKNNVSVVLLSLPFLLDVDQF